MTARSLSPDLVVGTLGSAATFAGEATALMTRRHPRYHEVRYFESLEALWAALETGAVNAIVIGIERTGQNHEGMPIVQHGYHVHDQLYLPIACNLYVKPGTRAKDVVRITGHGSIHQCKRYLDRHFPSVPREVHALNSVAAARDLLLGDGTVAVVGSRSVPDLVPGLEILAEDIGDGAVSGWWLISREEKLSPLPSTVIVSGTFRPDGELGRLANELSTVGLSLTIAASFASGEVSTYLYLLTFTGGPADLEEVRAIVSTHTSARLAGALQPFARERQQ